MTMPVLLIVTASTRPSRIGPSIARWVAQEAREHGQFEVSEVDLAQLGLPLLDEPAHPRLQQYTNDLVWDWSEAVDRADAVVFVSPEYDYTMPASLLNAVQTLSREWAYKPLGLVTYGGVSGGLRSAQTIRLLASSVGMYVVLPAVAIPFVAGRVDEGVLAADDALRTGAHAVFAELDRVQDAFWQLRKERRASENRRPGAGG